MKAGPWVLWREIKGCCIGAEKLVGGLVDGEPIAIPPSI